MARTGLAGTRIRERRLMLGQKQAHLAKAVGISPAYLNLIEHNRRRIAGKLLSRLAHALDVEPGALAEGAEAAQVAALRDAAADAHGSDDPGDAEGFAGRFPGWARLVVDQHRRITALEHSVEALNERMAHDPFLSASLHDLLSAVASINAASSILIETRDIEGEWRDRFDRNIHEDSQRMAEVAQSLARYLDGSAEMETGAASPQEEVETWLARRGPHLPELERALPPAPATLLADSGLSAAAMVLAEAHLDRYAADARAMPLGRFQTAAADSDPIALAGQFGVDVAAVLRRLASLPGGSPAPGVLICDGSGTLTFRQAAEGFAVPRFGSACPLWPLYQTLSRPMVPIRRIVQMPGRDAPKFLTYAVAQPVAGTGFDGPVLTQATMLILPVPRGEDGVAVPVGSSCRICPREGCAGRREPSILSGEI